MQTMASSTPAPASASTSTPGPSTPSAPILTIPPQTLTSIEYPGYIRTNPSSISKAFETLGGPKVIDQVISSHQVWNPNEGGGGPPGFHPLHGGVGGGTGGWKIGMGGGGDGGAREAGATGEAGAAGEGGAGVEAGGGIGNGPQRKQRILELRLRTGDAFEHPVHAEGILSSNIVLKVTKRRRKRRNPEKEGGATAPNHLGGTSKEKQKEEDEGGIFTMEPMGVITKTYRFRSMADFQFQPELEDPVIKLADAMRNLDATYIQNHHFRPPEETEIYKQGHPVNALPPPIFSRTTIPFLYNFKPNHHAIKQDVLGPHGDTITRLVMPRKGKEITIQLIGFKDRKKLPTQPKKDVKEGVKNVSDEIMNKMKELFDQRPVWTRQALLNQFPHEDTKRLISNKSIIHFYSYSFTSGPFSEMICRYGYDPRKDKKARFYQRIALRNPRGASTRRVRGFTHPNVKTPDEAKRAFEDSRSFHVFDGKTARAHLGNFQLIDVSDPLIKSMINEDKWGLRKEKDGCHEVTGWYTPKAFGNIRRALRRRFLGIISGELASDEDLKDLLPPTLRKDGESGGEGDDDDEEVGRDDDEDDEEEGGEGDRDENRSISVLDEEEEEEEGGKEKQLEEEEDDDADGDDDTDMMDVNGGEEEEDEEDASQQSKTRFRGKNHHGPRKPWEKKDMRGPKRPLDDESAKAERIKYRTRASISRGATS